MTHKAGSRDILWTAAKGSYIFLFLSMSWFLCTILLGAVCLLAPVSGDKTNPQVWDHGKWNDYDESPVPGELQPYPPKSDSWRSDETSIMVSISSFRDYRCSRTLKNLFTKAHNPNRVYVGVIQQNEAEDPDCLYDYCVQMKELRNMTAVTLKESPDVILEGCPYVEHVRMMRVSAGDAKGPTYGRYLGSKLLGDEEFCMQTDAHMDFLFDWDVLLLDMWGLIRNEYAVLSTYVPRLEEMGINANERWEIPHICRTFFTPGDRMVRNEQAKAAIWLTRPKLTSTWGAGFAFNKCHAERRTPYDPHLPSIFDGEEFTKFARLWTRGYDTYTPHRSVVYHDYNHGPTTVKAGSWARKQREIVKSADRLRTLLGSPDAKVPRNSSAAHELLGRWDLGNARTLDQLIDFTGVDARQYKITKSSCGKLAWVPFDEDDMDNDGDPMVTAYGLYDARVTRQQREKEVDRRLASSGGDPLLAEKVEGSEKLQRALLSLALSCISLVLLVAWWWEGNRIRSIPE